VYGRYIVLLIKQVPPGDETYSVKGALGMEVLKARGPTEGVAADSTTTKSWNRAPQKASSKRKLASPWRFDAIVI
jgi:hypothetical protein